MKHMESFGCYTKAIMKKNRHQDNVPAIITIGQHHTRALNSGGKMKISEKHQSFEAIR